MKKKILFILPSFKTGGEAKNTLNILNSLNADKFDLVLLLCTRENNELKKLVENEVQIIELNKRNNILTFFQSIQFVCRIQADLIFTSFVHLNFIINFYKFLSSQKFISILRFNTLPSNNLLFLNGLQSFLFEYFIKKADIIIAQSREMRDEILKFYSLPPHKVQIIKNIINHKQIEKLANEYIPYPESPYTTLVAVGSLWEVKVSAPPSTYLNNFL